MEHNNKYFTIQNEQWIRWEPIKDLSEKYYVDAISDTKKGFRITLLDAHNEKKKVKIFFKKSVDFYQSTEETLTIKRLDELFCKYGEKFPTTWTFFKVTNSSYVQWLANQSCGIIEPQRLIHYAVLAIDYFVDIVDPCEPVVTLMEK